MQNSYTSKKPKQCVILCGGLGERLLPYTKNIPKPMILCNGKPFLWYLLDSIHSEGIKSFCLLIGYLGEQIKEYFKDGKEFGWDIKYSHGPVSWKTGRRLWEAKDLFQDTFLLLYSDNFSLLNLDDLYNQFKKNNKPITFSLFKRYHGNVNVNSNNEVMSYSQKRNKANLNHVEIGYMIINKSLFNLFSNFNCDFSYILEKCAKNKILGAYIQKDYYYSVSDPLRWKVTEDYLKKKKIILIDRDGVINQKSSKGRYIEHWSDFKWIKVNLNAMKKLSKHGFSFIVITNQAGVNRGLIDKKELSIIHKNMTDQFIKNDINIIDVFHCPHHWEEECSCRKPKAGMFFQASNKWLFRLDKTLYIGDDPRDMEAAINAGCGGIFLGSENDLKTNQKKNIKNISTNLDESICKIISFFGE